MAPTGKDLGLGADELAFYFESDVGIDASDLGVFLQRAAVVARRAGADLRVVGIERGSLLVKLRAFKKSKIYRNAKKEFINKPLTGAAQIAGVVGTTTAVAAAAAAAISWAFSGPQATPLAKSGAEVVEKCDGLQINLITNEKTSILVNEKIAREIREKERRAPQIHRLPAPEEIRLLSYEAERGGLTGAVEELYGEPHFRPDGYRFWVPLVSVSFDLRELVIPGHYRVAGKLIARGGRPDSIIISKADRI
jgi:hypothetical protein